MEGFHIKPCAQHFLLLKMISVREHEDILNLEGLDKNTFLKFYFYHFVFKSYGVLKLIVLSNN